ncbi:MAG: hypothetical protein ACPG8W_19770 [Candidatus Promineifilaceae bacterium]
MQQPNTGWSLVMLYGLDGNLLYLVANFGRNLPTSNNSAKINPNGQAVRSTTMLHRLLVCVSYERTSCPFNNYVAQTASLCVLRTDKLSVQHIFQTDRLSVQHIF